jgi:serine/threonine protein kinase
MELSVENICGLLIRSRLLTTDAVKTMYGRWQSESKSQVGNTARFTKWLVANQYVTEYQASHIARGRADSFFLNDYQILDRLGRGRMAGVYKAVHSLGQMVAIKILPPSRAKNPEMLGRFQREARLAMHLNHPNIVRTFQVGEVNGLHYLVMEYLEGETVDDVLKRRGLLPPAEAAHLIYQALLGLEQIHHLGMVHRDLKPTNLMLVSPQKPGTATSAMNATVKILDIGLGRELFDEDLPEGAHGVDQLTTEGSILGTPDYMSPEQARDSRSVDIRADIYSLGCVLYQLLAGRVPFPDTNLVSQMIRHATEPPRPLKEFSPAVPDGLQQIVNWMMAKEAKDRYPTPQRSAQALQVFLVAGTEPVPTMEVEPKMRPYLNWLESGQRGGAGAGPEAGGQLPASPSSAPGPGILAGARAALSDQALKPIVIKKGRSRSAKSGHKHRPKHSKLPHRVLAEAPSREHEPDAASTVDVELVPALPWQEIAISVRGLVLSRRDLLMLGIGAGCVAAAGLVGMAVARLTGRKARTAPLDHDGTDSDRQPTNDGEAASS